MTLLNGILSHLDLAVNTVWTNFHSRAMILILVVYRYPPLRKPYAEWNDVSRMTYWATWTVLDLPLNPSRDLDLPLSPLALLLPLPLGLPLDLVQQGPKEKYLTTGNPSSKVRPRMFPQITMDPMQRVTRARPYPRQSSKSC